MGREMAHEKVVRIVRNMCERSNRQLASSACLIKQQVPSTQLELARSERTTMTSKKQTHPDANVYPEATGPAKKLVLGEWRTTSETS